MEQSISNSTLKSTMTKSYPSERTLDDIYTYEKQALDLLNARFKGKEDHPNYTRLKDLLIDQINDELHDITHTITNRRTS